MRIKVYGCPSVKRELYLLAAFSKNETEIEIVPHNLSQQQLQQKIDQTKADFSAELKIDKLNINTLTTKVPAVDTMLPMLRSFEGLISTDIIAVGEFDSTLNINMPSLVASCYLRGDSLVLLDNKTFQKFSKLLLFKNKERNLIDSLAVEIIMKQQVISFMPFVLQLDRYKVGITGTQYINMKVNSRNVLRDNSYYLNLLINFHAI